MNAEQIKDINLILEKMAELSNGWKPTIMRIEPQAESSYLKVREEMLHSVEFMLTRTVNDLHILRDLNFRYGSTRASFDSRFFDLIISELKLQISVLETHPMLED